MRVGAERISEIVKSLRNFSRLDEAEVKEVDIHEGIDSTLMILDNRLKATSKRSEIHLIKEYSTLPLVTCYPGQLNQVFMNIISNAIDVLEERDSLRLEQIEPNSSTIWIRTKVLDRNAIAIQIADNGSGIPQYYSVKKFS
jgi:two-component system, NtrC family, sensor kinase